MSRIILLGLKEHPKNECSPNSYGTFQDLPFPICATIVPNSDYNNDDFDLLVDVDNNRRYHITWFVTDNDDVNKKIQKFLDKLQ